MSKRGSEHPRAKFTLADRQAAARMYDQGVDRTEIARQLKCHRWTVSRWLYEDRPGSLVERESLTGGKKP